MGTSQRRERPGGEPERSGAKRKLHVGCNSNEISKRQSDRQAFRHRVEALETIADWQDDLKARLDRAQLRFELIGFDIEEQRALYIEGQALKRVCRALSYSGRAAH